MAESGKTVKRRDSFHWNIKDFRFKKFHSTPCFQMAGRTWTLKIFLQHSVNGWWYSLTLTNFCEANPYDCVRLGFKTAEGMIMHNAVKTAIGREFTAKIIAYSDVTDETREQIFPQGYLYVVCEIVTQDTNGTWGDWTNDAEENVASKSVKKLQLDLGQLYLGKQHSDVVLRVERKEFRAHRIILAARSPVFAAMFSHDMREKTSGVVAIEDNDSDTFSDFLHYLYAGRVPKMNAGNAVMLYKTADKYQVPELKDECLIFMIKNITRESVCAFLNLALQHREGELIAAAKNFISEQ